MPGVKPASSSSGAKPGRAKAQDAATWSRDSIETKSPTGKRRTSYARQAATKNLDTFRQNREYQVSPGVESSAKRQKTRTPEKAEGETKDTTENPFESISGPAQEKVEEKPVWKPSIVVGSPLYLQGEDLSRIELADRKIAHRQAMLNYYGDITNISQLLSDAIEERNKLDDDDEENTLPLSSLPSTHKTAIDTRTNHLREALKTAEFLPERQNILAAISGYESGQIPYSDVYTLIWGGHIVDTSPDYPSFVRDRPARLDRYHQQHGDGWLWYEPPLKEDTPGFSPAAQIQAQKALCLNSRAQQPGEPDTINHYFIDMGFQRRIEHVARYAIDPNWNPALDPYYDVDTPRRSTRVRKQQAPPNVPINYKTATTHDPNAPRVYLECMVDSGASVPLIFSPDLATLGINTKTYAAQTIATIVTANGPLQTPVYELDVGIFKPEIDNANLHLSHWATLVDENEPIWPSEVDMLGGTMPVAVKPGGMRGTLVRLSGMLPFMVCYISSAPGKSSLWLGEDRFDVVGSDRLPGQLRYHAILDDNREPRREMETGHQEWGNPARNIGPLTKVIFEHDLVTPAGGTMRDEDHGEGKSYLLMASQGVNLTTFPAAGPQGHVLIPGAGLGTFASRWVIDPRNKPEQVAPMQKRRRQN